MSPAKIKKLFLIIYGLSIFSAFYSLFFFWLLEFYGLIFFLVSFTAPFIVEVFFNKESEDVFNKTSESDKKHYLKTRKKIHHIKADFFTDDRENNILLSIIKNFDGSLFENLCLDYIKSLDCEASKTSHGADGGVDINFLYGKGKKGIVQCKCFSKKNVSVKMVRELYGVMVAQKADKAVFITSTDFTKDAKKFLTTTKNFYTISGVELASQINQSHRYKELIQKILTSTLTNSKTEYPIFRKEVCYETDEEHIEYLQDKRVK